MSDYIYLITTRFCQSSFIAAFFCTIALTLILSVYIQCPVVITCYHLNATPIAGPLKLISAIALLEPRSYDRYRQAATASPQPKA